MTESAVSVFDGLVNALPPARAPVLFDTACVLGGSVAGLMAARVLSDHARQVIIIEADELPDGGRPRAGTPQDQHAHVLQPAGFLWLDRWLPGFAREALSMGAATGESLIVMDGRPQPRVEPELYDGMVPLLTSTRFFLEDRIRARVRGLPNVTFIRGLVRDVRCPYGTAGTVVYGEGGPGAPADTRSLETDFVVDAMGRSSRMADWVAAQGYDKPALERLKFRINYATARFARVAKAEDPRYVLALSLFSPGQDVDGVTLACVNAVEGGQWGTTLVGYGEDRPGVTIEALRATAGRLRPLYGQATAGEVTQDVVTHHQADSRRRDFTRLGWFPARLVSVGDAVASFNPMYGQGMSAAALHAAALSAYLRGDPDLTAPATRFFGLQQVVIDAAWGVSAGNDAARLDADNGVPVPEEVRQRRWAAGQITRASVLDADIAAAFQAVNAMLRHPVTLSDPEILQRAVTVNREAAVPV